MGEWAWNLDRGRGKQGTHMESTVTQEWPQCDPRTTHAPERKDPQGKIMQSREWALGDSPRLIVRHGCLDVPRSLCCRGREGRHTSGAGPLLAPGSPLHGDRQTGVGKKAHTKVAARKDAPTLQPCHQLQCVHVRGQ